MDVAKSFYVNIDSDNNATSEEFGVRYDNRSKKAFTVQENGDISFYEDTGTTPKLVWKSANERLGIGTSTPFASMHIQIPSATSTETEILRLTDGTYCDFKVFLDRQTTLGTSISRVKTAAGSMAFETSETEAMRIDSSGNLLVGKTAVNYNNVGSGFLSTGEAQFTASAVNPLEINRKATDGSIVNFRKDGSFVGSIGVNADRIYLAGAAEGVYIDNSLNAFSPCTTSGGNYDNHVDLGGLSSRFKDLHLSGTANVNTVDFGDWTITESGGNLYFATGGTNKMKLAADGTLQVAGDIESNATIS
jgi:hypothetical protein